MCKELARCECDTGDDRRGDDGSIARPEAPSSGFVCEAAAKRWTPYRMGCPVVFAGRLLVPLS